MPVFFSGPPGRTAVLDDPAAGGSVALVRLDPAVDWAGQRSIVTRVSIAQRGNHQFLHTLGNELYVYAFGDRVGQMTLAGLCGVPCGAADAPHGLEQLNAWYRENRVSRRQGPVRVTLGANTAFDAFVDGVSLEVVDPGLRLGAFTLSLAVPPEE
jgi:hypothetical protein